MTSFYEDACALIDAYMNRRVMTEVERSILMAFRAHHTLSLTPMAIAGVIIAVHGVTYPEDQLTAALSMMVRRKLLRSRASRVAGVRVYEINFAA